MDTPSTSTLRISLSFCFFISGVLFFLLLIDSHYKSITNEILQTAKAAMVSKP